MHDEVSETENIRQNLAIERMIIGGCDILLDVNQVFVRQGILLQVVDDKAHKSGRSRLSSLSVRGTTNLQQQLDADDHYQHLAQLAQRAQSGQQLNYLNHAYSSSHHQNQHDSQTKELVRQCFLFTNHLLLCTRTKDGKLRLLEVSCVLGDTWRRASNQLTTSGPRTIWH